MFLRRFHRILPSLAVGVLLPQDEKFTENKWRMEKFVKDIQSQMIDALESVDKTAVFKRDHWKKAKDQGHGVTAVIQDTLHFDKAGVNYSVLRQKAPKRMLMQMADKLKVDLELDYEMFVAGVSMVIHPKNVNAPTFHANFRYFELTNPNLAPISWYGGGCDLTPSYLYPSDAIHFHTLLKQTCDAHDKSYYPRFKAWCDKYFRNTHRGEARGVGGIFFDDLQGDQFDFVRDCGNALTSLYIPILQKRIGMEFDEEMQRWGQLRRGIICIDYVGVRIESVLMSLPLTARWEYCYEAEEGSRESQLLKVLREPLDWVNVQVDEDDQIVEE